MATLASLADGALVKFGSIYGKPIIWRVAGQNHYASGQTSLISDRIIKYMCVDAKEPSNSDSNRKNFGNNRYIYSNVHQWLNSDAVSWCSAQHSADALPSNANVWSNYNEYDAFPGFLNGFTTDEKNAICNTSLTCERASVDGGGTDSFTAKVFLLSCTEVGLSGGQVCGTQFPMFNSDSARLVYGTAEAVANSEYKESYISTTSPGFWWLRDALASYSCYARLVDASGFLSDDNAFRGNLGARPALNLPSSISLSNSTDSDGCYTLVFPTTVTFNSNSGIFSSDSTTTKSVQTNLDGTVSLSFLVEFPIKQSYVFKGWSTTENGVVAYTPYATPTITDDITLYAVWQEAESYLVREDTFVNIANAIRAKTSTAEQLTLGDMGNMISSLSTFQVIDIGSGNIIVGYYIDEACTVDATIEQLVNVSGDVKVYRKIVSEQILSYYGTATNLVSVKSCLAATTVGDYALFGGGTNGNGAYSTVDAYNTSLTKSTPSALSVARYNLAATTVGDYALFGGGSSSNGNKTTVDAYNTSLTKSTPSALSVARYNLAATTVGDYALFGGGFGSADSRDYKTTVDAYNTSLTKSTPSALSVGRDVIAATTVGDYALFAGGSDYDVNGTSTVDAYDTSLVRITPSSLSTAKRNMGATTIGDYALFGGGAEGYTYYNTVDAYNTSLTRSTPSELNNERSNLAATTVGDYALFGGGYNSSNSKGLTTVDVYNTSLIKRTTSDLSVARYNLAATTVGDYALFGGGRASNSCNTVDVYTVV